MLRLAGRVSELEVRASESAGRGWPSVELECRLRLVPAWAIGVGGTGVDVDVLVGGTGVSVGTGVGGTGVGVRVSNGSAVGSGSSEEQALNPIAATTTTAVNAATAMKKMPTRDSREGRVPNDFNAVIKSQRLARAVSRYDESRQPLSTESTLYRAIEHQHPSPFCGAKGGA